MFDKALSVVSKTKLMMTPRVKQINAGLREANTYREAMRHVNASEVNLTHMYMSVDLRGKNEVAYFPISCLKEHDF